MLQLIERINDNSTPQATLTLSFEQRQRSRLFGHLDDGQKVALRLPRGTVLHDGDRLRADNGAVVNVQAAAENVSTVRTDDPILLARVSYHLGNRHVAVQIGNGWLRYQADYVLDALVKKLGASVEHECVPFEAEPGAYHDQH